MTRLIIANLLIVTAVIMLGLAYRLKQKQSVVEIFPQRVKRPARSHRRRWPLRATSSRPGRIERLLLELSIVFSSARYGLIGV